MGTGPAAGSGRVAAPAAAGLILAAALATWAGLRWPAAFDALVLDRDAVLAGQAWRLWSAHLLHLDARHAALNLAALALLALLAARMRLLAPLLGASLLLMPAISAGLLHGCVAWLLVRHGGAWALAGLAVLAAKLLWEALMPATPSGAMRVVVEAHQAGAIAGALLGAIGAWRYRQLLGTRTG